MRFSPIHPAPFSIHPRVCPTRSPQNRIHDLHVQLLFLSSSYCQRLLLYSLSLLPITPQVCQVTNMGVLFDPFLSTIPTVGSLQGYLLKKFSFRPSSLLTATDTTALVQDHGTSWSDYCRSLLLCVTLPRNYPPNLLQKRFLKCTSHSPNPMPLVKLKIGLLQDKVQFLPRFSPTSDQFPASWKCQATLTCPALSPKQRLSIFSLAAETLRLG